MADTASASAPTTPDDAPAAEPDTTKPRLDEEPAKTWAMSDADKKIAAVRLAAAEDIMRRYPEELEQQGSSRLLGLFFLTVGLAAAISILVKIAQMVEFYAY